MLNLRKLSYLFIGLGLLFILFPKATEWNEDREQHKLLQAAELSLEKSNSVLPSSLADSYARLSTRVAEAPVSEARQHTFPSPAPNASVNEQTPIATISISRIALKLPVLEGATRKNMKYAAVHMPETGKLGQVGNAAIAAHRARTPGRLFNRLHELKIGDKIVVNAQGSQYMYKVYSIKVVDPMDVSVLKSFKNHKLLTLITCDPLVNPTHRLIVQAKLST
ncbi:class D sortase [Paenibacillus polymyxa]|uniref:Sortase n=1 Tax=Paenibacillus polymyxa TaxID=1406 RepID=A0A378XQY1_PAEPO|nr:class D sortase [Paenibacillus polymyxa]MEB4784496.1 class D sortase [Paenibacillus jamilae]KAE8558897.1 class C sortase [Paenibacillus polymyxa]MBE7901154.1 class D sortase [Paenibacillus polymyxa]MBG9763606.1 sortase [Paenibacillus polymyxa]MCC3261706.1 class D sortase [Paenibacillus polymyxa]